MSDNFTTTQQEETLNKKAHCIDFLTTGSDDLNNSYDHMYATNDDDCVENGLNDETIASCQTINNQQQQESEVNFLKDFLLIHLDLIQQQNDEILTKDNAILLLQQENERLRERLRCVESGLPYQSTSNNKLVNEESSPKDILEDMTVDQLQKNDDLIKVPEDCPNNCVLAEAHGRIDIDSQDNQSNEISTSKSSPVQNEIFTEPEISIKQEEEDEPDQELDEDDTQLLNNKDSTHTFVNNSDFTNASYTIHSNSYSTTGSVKNIKMSIRRKRLCSNSSAVSNNDSMSDEKKNFKRSRKKRKRLVQNDQLLTHSEQYVTQVGDRMLDVLRRQELANEAARASSNLEVPRWRVKVYTSCYTMEGTENLEDEVFLRRHNRLENDERRRKRWDVQRIREQRIIEKLKQRQDKIDSNNRVIEQCETVDTLWPSIDDIKFVEIAGELPVAAFGSPIPKIQPSEFSLPWLTNPNSKKVLTRRSTGRRRGNKR